MRSVLLIGAPGTGKTLLAAQLEILGWRAGDTGQALARHYEMDEFFVPIDVPSDERLRAEREIFANMLDDVEGDLQGRFVIAVGSEILGDDDEGRDLVERVAAMRSGGGLHVIQLTASLSELVKRNGLMGQRSAGVIMPRKNFRELMERRRPIYDSVTDTVIDTTDRTPEEIAKEIDADTNA